MFSSSPFALLDMPLLNVEGETHSSRHLTHSHHPWRPMEADRVGCCVSWFAEKPARGAWEQILPSRRNQTWWPVSQILVYHYCFHFHQLCWSGFMSQCKAFLLYLSQTSWPQSMKYSRFPTAGFAGHWSPASVITSEGLVELRDQSWHLPSHFQLSGLVLDCWVCIHAVEV